MNKMQSTPKGKKEQMRQMFNRIATHYDSLNHIMSLNIDRSWRKRGVALVAQGRPQRILDLATGTADLAIEMAERMPEAAVVGVGYILSSVPIALEWGWWALLNVGFVVAIVLLMLLPASVVATVKPDETMRYE